MNAELDALSRPALLDQARRLGVERPERMTRVELRDEIIRRQASEGDLDARGLFGVARSMLASVVEAGLKMPDAARAIRGEANVDFPTVTRSPVATVTLAEIYAAQGHPGRARSMLKDVLKEEPDHEEARRVLDALARGEMRSDPRSEPASALAPPVVVKEPEPLTDGEAAEHAALASDPRYVETTGETLESGPLPPVAPVAGPPPAPAPAEGSLTDGEQPVVVAPEADAAPLPTTYSTEPAAVEPATEPTVEPTVEPTEPAAAEPTVEPATEPGAAEGVPTEPALFVAGPPSALRLYFELPLASLESCGVDPAHGSAVVRLVGFEPRGDRPERRDVTRVVDGACGQLEVLEFGASAVVRAALGWLTGDDFLPLTVARPLTGGGAGDAELRAKQALGV